MLLFELYRQLDIRIFQTMSAVDPTYGSCARYILDKDSLVLLGSDHSVRLDIISKQVSRDNPIRNWDTENEAVLWFAEDSMEAALLRLINDAFRRWLELDANITQEYFRNEVDNINGYLEGYELKIFADENGMGIYRDGDPLTFEQAVNLIMEIDENRMDEAGIEALINEAFFYRNMDKYEESALRLEKVARYVDHSQPIYTNVIFTLAETYYFMGNYDRAVVLYYRVNMDFINDKTDYYIHLGHALLDERMRRYERNLRIYFHSRISEQYADTHRQAVTAAKAAVGEVYDEYETTCLEMGQKKYEEHKALLPKDADDIDEVIEMYENPEEKPDNDFKRYEGFRLKEPTVSSGENVNSVSALLSEALDLYLGGEYQKAFEVYCRLKEIADPQSDYYTWIYFQLGKLYTFFDDSLKAVDALAKCDPARFGMVYRLDDFLLLYRHSKIITDDFENDLRFRRLLRGKLDPYFGQYDREYNLLLKDKKLCKAYGKYEKECREEAEYELADVLGNPAKRGGILGRIFGKRPTA